MQIRVFSLILLLVLQPMLTSSSVFADTKSSLEDYNIENVVIKNEDSNLPEDTTFEIIKDETIFNIEIESQSEDEVLTQPILTIENETTSDDVRPESLVYISKIYSKDGEEFIEIFNSGEDLAIENFTIYRITSKDNEIVSFKPGIFLAGQSVLIRQKDKSFNPGEATEDERDYDAYYTSNSISQNANLKLNINGYESTFCAGSSCDSPTLSNDFIAEICLRHEEFEEDCANPGIKSYFKNHNIASPTLFRSGFMPNQLPKPSEPEGNVDEDDQEPKNLCENFKINEVAANSSNQFIEIINAGAKATLKGCIIQTNRNSRSYALEDIWLENGELFIIDIARTELSLTKTTKGAVYIINQNNDEVDSVNYENLKTDTTWALFVDGWKQTFAQTPGEENIYVEFLPCLKGYERNLETNKCRKLAVENELASCDENQYRNPETGRCKKYEAQTTVATCANNQYRNPETGRCKKYETATSLVACAADQYRNPETNRCKKITDSSPQLTPCKEGYTRNPDTNRCRKAISNTSASDGIEISDEETQSQFTGWIALVAITSIAGLLIIWEYRVEIGQFFIKIKQQASKKR